MTLHGRHTVLCAFSLGVITLGWVARARADVGTSLPLRFVVGPSPGAAAIAGVNASRDHSSAQPLPRAPRVLWTKSVAGGIACEILADDAGRLFIAGFGRLTQLSPDGSLGFTRRYPFSRALAAALLNDGTRVVLTEDSQLIGVWEDGTPRFAVRLNGASLTTQSLLPLWDGGVLVAVGAWLLNFDAKGVLRGSAEFGERVRVSLSLGRNNLIVGMRGGVYRWDGYSEVTRAGAFGRAVLDAALNRPDSIVARLDGDELTELSLSTGALKPLSDGALLAGSSPRRTTDRNGWVTMGPGGTLILLRFGAEEPHAAALAAVSALPTAPSALWLSDSERTLATAAAGAPLTIQHADGGVDVLPVRCAEPLSLIPAGDGRIALGCRSGQLWLVGEASHAAAAPSGESKATGH